MELEFRHLEVFCAVVSLRSFSRAASKVHLSQASVSERIAALEDQIGCRLLDRTGRGGVRVTPVGQALYRRALRMLEDREHTVQELHDLLGLQRGTVAIGASTVPGTYLLPRLLKQFSSLYPATRFSVSITGSEQVVDRVAEGTLEVGIVGDPGGRQVERMLRGQRGATRTRLWSDELVIIVPAGHPLVRDARVPLAQLARLPFVMREPGSGTRRWLELYLQDELPGGVAALEVVAEMGSLGAVKQAVMQGLGISIVSACAVRAEVAAGLLRTLELEGVTLTRAFHLVRNERRTPSPLCRRFIDFLLEAGESRQGRDRAAPRAEAGQKKKVR